MIIQLLGTFKMKYLRFLTPLILASIIHIYPKNSFNYWIALTFLVLYSMIAVAYHNEMEEYNEELKQVIRNLEDEVSDF